MDRYDPLKIEQKWQKIWAETKAFRAGPIDDSKPKNISLLRCSRILPALVFM